MANKKTKIVLFHTVDSKPVKQEVNGTMILPPLVFPAVTIDIRLGSKGLPETNTLAYFSGASAIKRFTAVSK